MEPFIVEVAKIVLKDSTWVNQFSTPDLELLNTYA